MPASSGSRSDAARGEGWLVAQALLLAAIVVAGLVSPTWRGIAPWLAVPAGAALLALGALLGLLGVRTLGPSLTPFPRPREGGSLIGHGIYARVRHPIYGGLMLGSVGWALLTASLVALVLASVAVVFFVLKARREEQWLVERYPEYDSYRRRIRRRFIPWLA